MQAIQSFSPHCTLDPTIFYTVIIEDSSLEEVIVFLDSCNNGLCSITLTTPGQYCHVGVRAGNVVGNSSIWYAHIGEIDVSNLNCQSSLYLFPNEGGAKLTPSNLILIGFGVTLVAVALTIKCSCLWLDKKV